MYGHGGGGRSPSVAQRPDLVRIEAQIKHAERKREKAEQELEKLRQTESEQKKRLESLQADLETVRRAANAAQGVLALPFGGILFKRPSRGAAEGGTAELIAQ